MEDLAEMLSMLTDRPVIDKTDLKGFYNFSLEAENSKTDPISLSIFKAVEEQIGLKLEAANEPAEVLVIDAAKSLPATESRVS